MDAEVVHAQGEESPQDIAERESDIAVDAGAGATRETPAPPPQTHLGPALNGITSPEAAVSALKAKMGILHTITHNVGHFSTLAFNDVEQLLADIRWLVNYIRSKV